jgi:hypothetical protein
MEYYNIGYIFYFMQYIMTRDSQYTSWHDLLGQLIENTQMKQSIAQAVHVKPVTLQRWVSQQSTPRNTNMRALQQAIPSNYRQLFQQLVARDMPAFAQQQEQGSIVDTELPSQFYTQVLNAYTHTPTALYPQALCDLILQQAIAQMDPERMGMIISIVQCMPPRQDQKVRSLREIYSIGTPPWENEDDHHHMFLGADSLAGSVIIGHRPVQSANKQTPNPILPVKWEEHEQSAIAHRIAHQTHIAGCLLAVSIHPHFFTDAHEKLMAQYANITALAFEPEQFFAHQNIALFPMPNYEQQKPFFLDFQRRITAKFRTERQHNRLLTFHQAQESVWMDIETSLLQQPLTQP